MWSKSVSLKTAASKSQIWKQWINVDNWNQWDDQVKESALAGSFSKGQKGQLTPTSGPKSTFELTEVTDQQSFTTSAKLPFGKMDFIHSLEATEEGLILTHGIEISGPLTFLFSRVIGKKLISELPKALKKLNEKALKTATV